MAENIEVKFDSERDNKEIWMVPNLENCFGRNKNNKRCSALSVTYCGDNTQNECPFYKPAKIAMKEIEQLEKRFKDFYSKNSKHKLISGHARKEIRDNQKGRTTNSLKLKDLK